MRKGVKDNSGYTRIEYLSVYVEARKRIVIRIYSG